MFLKEIQQNYNNEAVSLVKMYINNCNNIRKSLAKKEFLLNCKADNLHHKKIINVCNKLKHMHFFSRSANKKHNNIYTRNFICT